MYHLGRLKVAQLVPQAVHLAALVVQVLRDTISYLHSVSIIFTNTFDFSSSCFFSPSISAAIACIFTANVCRSSSMLASEPVLSFLRSSTVCVSSSTFAALAFLS